MPSEILPKIFLSNCFEVLLGGGLPLQSQSNVLLQVLCTISPGLFSLLCRSRERCGGGCGSLAAQARSSCGAGAPRCERRERKRAQLLPAAGQRTNPPVLLAVPC